MADKKEKEMKALVEALLASKNIKYSNWLHQKHMEFLIENSGTVLAALKQTKKEND